MLLSTFSRLFIALLLLMTGTGLGGCGVPLEQEPSTDASIGSATTLSATAPELATTAPASTPIASSQAEGKRFILTDYASVQSVADISRHDLDPSYRPLDLHGHHYTSIGPDGELYLIDWVDGQRKQLTHDGLPKTEAVLSQQFVAWIAQSAATTVQQLGQDYPEPLHHIFVRDRMTGEDKRITAQAAHRIHLAIDGTRLVWADKRNESAEHYTHHDIYAYDLATDTERPIAIAPGAQDQPSIHGDRVVWQDNRNSPHRDTVLAGCANCPENRHDLYLYDWSTGASRPLVEDDWLKCTPSVDAEHVAWVGYSNNAQADVYMLELKTGSIRRLTNTVDYKTSPVLAGDHVLWTIGRSCDVVEIGPDGQPIRAETGLYAFDVNTDVVRKLTDFIEPFVLADVGAALIIEGCMVGFTAYVVRLD